MIRALIQEIRHTFGKLSDECLQAKQLLSLLDDMDLSEHRQYGWQINEPIHGQELLQAINLIPRSLAGLADALTGALHELQWRVDRGTYYDFAADVGDGYRNGNMHCELIGPNGSAFYHDQFRLGLFLLTPRVLYRDHAHKASELYLTLSEPSGWRFDGGAWRDVSSGRVIWNPPDRSHATRVYDTPFLSIYCWTRDIHSKCRVVWRDDWDQIEAALPSRS